MPFELARTKSAGALSRTVERQLTRIEHEALIAAHRVQGVMFVHSAAAVAAANMVRTASAIAGGDPAVEMAVSELTGVGIAALGSIVAQTALRLR